MAHNEEKMGEYAYNRALQLIDYCGNIRNGVKGDYSPDYSPNNIRRLIISPDMVEVHYHITTGGNQKLRDCRILDDLRLSRAYFDHEGYKPMLQVLSADRVCGSIEELIFLTSSKVQGLVLNGKESDFESLVKDMPGDAMQNLAKRFKRLRYITVADGVTHIEYENYLRTHQQDVKAKDFLSDTEIFGNAKKITINPEWYNYWSTSAQFYMLDRNGSRLNSRFKEIKKKHEFVPKTERTIKEKPVDSSLKAKYDEALALYTVVHRDYTLMLMMQERLGVTQIVGSELPAIPAMLLPREGSDPETIHEKVQEFISERNNILRGLGGYYRYFLTKMQIAYPLTAELIIHNVNQMGGVNEKLIGGDCPTSSTNNIKASARIIFATLTRYGIHRDSNSKVTKYLQPEGWLEEEE